jgi:predicted LPLAT superfamily acyltransferase
VDPIVLAAGTALVTAMATDAWEQARTGAVTLWRRVRPEQADTVEKELAEVRAQMLAARHDGDMDTERALAGSWQVRLQQLLREDPALAGELRRVLDEALTPVLTPAEQTQIGSIVMKATASGSGRVYQAGRDQHITE